ncbi:MAG: glycosyltransferase family 4 protein [bacterium]|nr:MAG: glycosyltransferase family 4 protein [bacterium]
MRIGIVTQSYYPKPGGVTEVAHYTALGLRSRGHHVTIITTRYSRNDRGDSGIIRIGRNIIVPVNGAWVNVTAGIGLKRMLAGIFRREAFDIIQTHCPLVPTLPLLTLEAATVDQRIVGTFHATAESNIAYRLFRRALDRRAQRLDLRLAVSEPARRFAHKYFPGRYTVIPNGIDCERFNPNPAPVSNPEDTAIGILYVGRMDKRKGLPYLLRAIPIAQNRLKRKIRLTIVGEGRLRRLLLPKPLDLSGAEIRFCGRVHPRDLPQYYRSADIFCSPATGQESFGIVLLEAMASGVPVIASNIPGFRMVVTHRKDGLLVTPKSPTAIAEAIVELAEDNRLAENLRIQGRETAKRYDWPVVIDELERTFLQLLGQGLERRTRETARLTMA